MRIAISYGLVVGAGVAHAQDGSHADVASTCFPLSFSVARCMAGSTRFEGKVFVVEEESICDRGFEPIASLCDVPSLRLPSVPDLELVEGIRYFSPNIADAMSASEEPTPSLVDDATVLEILHEMAEELGRRVPHVGQPLVTTDGRVFRVTSSSDPVLDLRSSVDPIHCERATSVAFLSVDDVQRCAVASLGRVGMKLRKEPGIGGAGSSATAVAVSHPGWSNKVLWGALDDLYRQVGEGASGYSFHVYGIGDTRSVLVRPFPAPLSGAHP